MALPPKVYQFLVGLFASLGSWLYGYDLGVIAGVISCANFVTFFDEPSAVQTGLVVSLFTAGAFVGAGIAGYTGDFAGRRGTIALGCMFFCIGGAIQTGASSISHLYGGRFLAGTGVGVLTMMIPLYQAELCHPDIRGSVTALQQFMLGVGALCASWITYGTYTDIAADSTAQWRIPLGIQLLPAVVLGSLIFLFPESPRWLVDHGKNEKARRVLAQLHAHGDENDAFVNAEYEQIIAQAVAERELAAKSYVELFKDKSAFRRLVLAMALQASVQMTGVSAIQYYSVEIYAQVGISGTDTLKYQAINSIIALIGEFCNMVFVDKLGRRWPLIFGNLGNAVTFLVACILIELFPAGSGNNGAGWGFIIMTWVYNFSFSATCGPLSWVIPSEIFDLRTRAKGVAIATMTSYAFNTMIGQVTSIAIPSIGGKFYILFIVCNVTNALFFWAFLPETRRVPLEEMHGLFQNAPVFVAGKDMDAFRPHDLENRVEDKKIEAVAKHVENPDEKGPIQEVA